MTAQQLAQLRRQKEFINNSIRLCPICNKSIDIKRVQNPGSIEYVKGADRTIRVYHRSCIY